MLSLCRVVSRGSNMDGVQQLFGVQNDHTGDELSGDLGLEHIYDKDT